MDRRGQAAGLRDAYLRGVPPPEATQRQIEALAGESSHALQQPLATPR